MLRRIVARHGWWGNFVDGVSQMDAVVDKILGHEGNTVFMVYFWKAGSDSLAIVVSLVWRNMKTRRITGWKVAPG